MKKFKQKKEADKTVLHHRRCNVIQYGKDSDHDCDCSAVDGYKHPPEVVAMRHNAGK